MYRLAKIIPRGLRRRLEVFLIDRGFPTKKKRGIRGIEQRGNYLGLDAEGELVELGLRHELDRRVREDKAPEFVISYGFEFRRFSKSPTRALAVSLFSHLNDRDIRLCLQNLADQAAGPCQLFASYFGSERPTPNFQKSHPQLAFYYTGEQLQRMGHDAGWTPTFLGEWGSPAGQLMMRFTKD